MTVISSRFDQSCGRKRIIAIADSRAARQIAYSSQLGHLFHEQLDRFNLSLSILNDGYFYLFCECILDTLKARKVLISVSIEGYFSLTTGLHTVPAWMQKWLKNLLTHFVRNST